MELYVSGVKVPKLGSLLDIQARGYLTKRVSKEIAFAELLAQVAIGVGGGAKGWADKIKSVWSKYISAVYYLQDEIEVQETRMREEYEYWKKVKPKIYKEKGKPGLYVKGIKL